MKTIIIAIILVSTSACAGMGNWVPSEYPSSTIPTANNPYWQTPIYNPQPNYNRPSSDYQREERDYGGMTEDCKRNIREGIGCGIAQ